MVPTKGKPEQRTEKAEGITRWKRQKKMA